MVEGNLTQDNTKREREKKIASHISLLQDKGHSYTKIKKTKKQKKNKKNMEGLLEKDDDKLC
jgi:hypothetical protein